MAKDRRAGRRGLRGAVAALLCIGVSTSAMAWDRPQWVRQLGTSDYDESHGVATDGDGNIYISGNGFLVKYSAAGALLWTTQLEGTNPFGVATDGDGNVYISGLTGSLDAWLAKYSADGALLWTEQLGTDSLDISEGVATDGEGNVYITGWTEGSLGGPNQGINDAWLAKYSAAGDLLWTRQLGTDSFDYSHVVAIDGDGNVYISGRTEGSLGGANQGWEDAWVAKYSAAGDLLWTRQLGTPQPEVADSSNGVATDGEGNVYITGTTDGSLGGANQGGPDAYVAKYSTAGALRWVRQIGTSSGDVSEGVATDGDGNIYISGTTGGSLGGANQGLNDAWLAKYSRAGALRWKRQLGTSEHDLSLGVATDGEGNVYITGNTLGSLGGANAGLSDAFVAKYFTHR